MFVLSCTVKTKPQPDFCKVRGKMEPAMRFSVIPMSALTWGWGWVELLFKIPAVMESRTEEEELSENGD